MKTIKLYLAVWVTLLLVSCGRSHFTYYLKERNYTFSVEEKDKGQSWFWVKEILSSSIREEGSIWGLNFI